MRKTLLLALTLFATSLAFSQIGCYAKLKKAFEKRGANPVENEMHRHVYLSFIEPDGGSYCLVGKVRVEEGGITAIFIQYKEGDYELFEKKFYNKNKTRPTISNGISEMIFTEDGEKMRVVFIDKLKPKKRQYKEVSLPDDL